jgi:hypothetical protein
VKFSGRALKWRGSVQEKRDRGRAQWREFFAVR